MKDETLNKLRIFERSVDARNKAKRVITELKPIAEEAAKEVEQTAESVGKIVAEVEKVTGWRAFFCCK